MHNPFKELPASRELHSSKYIRRYEGNPILTAKDVPYDADYVFNAGVAFYRGEYFIAPRVDCHNPDWKPGDSRMRSIATGFGRSSDGIHFRMEPGHIRVHYRGAGSGDRENGRRRPGRPAGLLPGPLRRVRPGHQPRRDGEAPAGGP